ncbi:peptidase [Proteus mirabilis]|uniref:peptidase n=1 Tax=Proteus mirabilis TaxID=584 RepID=UPI003740E60E
MNLWQKLIMRRLYNEQHSEGGEGGGGTATEPTQETSATDKNEPPANSADPNKSTEKENGEEQGKPADKKNDANKSDVGAPEKYEFKAPEEGQELDKGALEVFEPIARELNLNNEQAQKLVDVYGSKIMPAINKQLAEGWQKQTEQWAETVKADKELSSAESIGAAQKAMDKFGSPELKQYLEESGLGNHPELIRIFAGVGKAMSEDGLVTGNSNGSKSAADVLFG